jgi:hypothetical protein
LRNYIDLIIPSMRVYVIRYMCQAPIEEDLENAGYNC